ncbi:MAG: HD domain-containing protein, partial [Bacteroidota bacterium]
MSNRTYSASWIRKLTSRMGRPVPAAPASSSLSDDTLRIWEAAESLPMSDFFESRLKDLVAVCKRELPDVDEAMIRTAYALAHWAHRDDLRKSGEPYFEHPVEVAFIVARDIHFDDTCVAAALLHDVVEDNRQITVDHIRELFGDTLAKIVDGVTKMEREFESREVRQAENFRKLLLSMATDIRVILVKFGDRLHNMRTISVLPERKRYKIATETQALFAPLAHRFGLYSIKNELEDLCLKVLDPDKYHKIANALAAKKTERELYVKSFIGPLRRKLKKNKFDFEIYGRSKHIYSIYRKMRRQNKEIDEIYDLFAIRIIINSEGRRGKED